MVPAVRPKEWNTGSTLNTLSVGLKSMLAAACVALARILRCVSTTPLGAPSDPDVNRMTPVSWLLPGTSGRVRVSRPFSLSARLIVWRNSSNQRKRT